MSITISSPQQIANAPTNNSTAKQQFSFSKAPRFTHATKTDKSTFFYDIPTSFERRAPSFGYGTKSDFTKERGRKIYTGGIPAPNTYPSPTDFDPKRPFSSAFSFGISREQCEKRYIEGHFKADPAVPGPGAYDPLKPLGSDAQKFSLKPKIESNCYLGDLFTSKQGPGPGAYNPKDALDLKGNYFLSKFKNSCAATFSPKSSRRFPNAGRAEIPGPGAYTTVESINKSGQYPVSKFRNSGVRSFSHSSREFFGLNRAQQTPAPGTYRLPSEFGYYESRNKSAMPSGSLTTKSHQILPKLVSPRNSTAPMTSMSP